MVNRKQPVFLPLYLYPSAVAWPGALRHGQLELKFAGGANGPRQQTAGPYGMGNGEASVPRGANGPRQQMAGPYGMGNWISGLPHGFYVMH